jgi:hypothetical protein
MAAGDDVIGTWKLVSLKFEFSDGGSIDPYGAAPGGYLIMGADGRMMALITAADRPASGEPAALFGSMMSYSGRYRLDGNRFITDVDLAWHPAWVGAPQEREYEVDDGRLLIRTAETIHPSQPDRRGRGILAWTRVS